MKKREMTIFGRFKSIRDAMMLSFSVLVVVAVLIFLLIAMNFTKKTIYENSRTSTSQLISQVNYDIDSYIDYMENISWVAASGSDLSRYLFNQEQIVSISMWMSGSRAGIRRRSIHRPGSRCHLLMCRMRSQAAITG